LPLQQELSKMEIHVVWQRLIISPVRSAAIAMNAYSSTVRATPFLDAPTIVVAIEVFKLDTVIGRTDRCASARFFIFAAGNIHVAMRGSLIGLHSISYADTGKEASTTSVRISSILRDKGAPTGVIYKYS